MKPEVFVLSAGHGPDHDYRWKTETDQRHDLSAELRERFAWLDDEHPSLLVERVHGEGANFRVLVAGFATERRDYRGRVIRNAILWQGLPSAAARSLALDFLRGRDGFCARCNAAIASKDDAPGGYTVVWQTIQNIAATHAPAPSKTAESSPKERPSNETETNATADLIAESDWPGTPAVLLLVTHLPTSSALRTLRERPVWRFHHEQAISQDLPPKAMPRSQPGRTTTETESNTDSKTWVAALFSDWRTWVVVALLASGATRWLIRKMTPETIPEKIEAPVNSGGQTPTPAPLPAQSLQ